MVFESGLSGCPEYFFVEKAVRAASAAMRTPRLGSLWRRDSAQQEPAFDAGDMHCRLQELVAAHEAVSAAAIACNAALTFHSALAYAEPSGAQAGRLAPYWRRGFEPEPEDLDAMHERLQELTGAPLPSVEAACDMWERLQELAAHSAAVHTADAARVAYNSAAAYAVPTHCLGQLPACWRRSFCSAPEDLDAMHERLQELTGAPLPSVEAACDMWERLQELATCNAAVLAADAAHLAYNTAAAYAEPDSCLGHLASYWRLNRSEPENLAAMHERLQELTGSAMPALAGIAALDLGDAWERLLEMAARQDAELATRRRLSPIWRPDYAREGLDLEDAWDRLQELACGRDAATRRAAGAAEEAWMESWSYGAAQAKVAPESSLPAVWRKDYVLRELDLIQAWERLEDLAASKAKAIAKAAEAAEEAWMESWSYAQSQQKVAPASGLPAIWRKDFAPQELDMEQAWDRLQDLAASKQAAAARAAEAAEEAWMESWGYEQAAPDHRLPAVWRKDYVLRELDMEQAWERLQDLAAGKQTAAARAAREAAVCFNDSMGYAEDAKSLDLVDVVASYWSQSLRRRMVGGEYLTAARQVLSELVAAAV
ncbi:hypothetical protein N2152v2_000272 [Parachlorella kessleri]